MPIDVSKLTAQQEKNIKRLIEVGIDGPEIILKHLSEIEENIDEKISSLVTSITGVSKIASQALTIASETAKKEGKAGFSPKKGVDYKDGDNYILTENDRAQIALKIKVPIVEKTIIEKRTEKIKEVPVVRETIKETIKNDLAPQELRNLLELLSGDERLDAESIRNLPELIRRLNPPVGPMLHTPSISNLPDVSIVGIAIGQSIIWDGIKFIPGNGSGGVASWTSFMVDGVTTTFSVSTKPTDVNNDGILLFNENGYSYNSIASTITFINPPQQFAGYR